MWRTIRKEIQSRRVVRVSGSEVKELEVSIWRGGVAGDLVIYRVPHGAVYLVTVG